jgi:hypothetical protein
MSTSCVFIARLIEISNRRFFGFIPFDNPTVILRLKVSKEMFICYYNVYYPSPYLEKL